MTRRLSPFRRRRGQAEVEAFPPPPPVAPDPVTPPPVLPEELQATTVFAAAGVASAAPETTPDLPANPGFRDRGRYRRRLRYLRRVRELGFRDLGGLVFDQYRFSKAGEQLVRGKLVALDAVDRELRALERAVDDRRTYFDLREPGIAACPRCAGLHGSDARFCPSCGMRLSGPIAVAEVGDAPLSPSIITPGSPTPQAAETAAAEHAAGAVSASQTGSTPVSAQPTDEVPPADPSEQPTTVAPSVQAPDPGYGGQ
jgi:hypothetical protein